MNKYNILMLFSLTFLLFTIIIKQQLQSNNKLKKTTIKQLIIMEKYNVTKQKIKSIIKKYESIKLIEKQEYYEIILNNKKILLKQILKQLNKNYVLPYKIIKKEKKIILYIKRYE